MLTNLAEWIELPQIAAPINGPQDTLMLADIPGLREPQSSVKPLRYEDLEHIIGTGFEDELEKFYEKHKSDFEALSNDNNVRPQAYGQRNQTIFNEDPWDSIDQIPTATVATTTAATENESIVDRPKNAFANDKKLPSMSDAKIPSRKNNSVKPTTPNTGTAPKKVVKLVKVKPKPLPIETSLSFGGFLKFLKDIQSSFVFGASRSLKDKMEMLANFRDTILINIGEWNNDYCSYFKKLYIHMNLVCVCRGQNKISVACD